MPSRRDFLKQVAGALALLVAPWRGSPGPSATEPLLTAAQAAGPITVRDGVVRFPAGSAEWHITEEMDIVELQPSRLRADVERWAEFISGLFEDTDDQRRTFGTIDFMLPARAALDPDATGRCYTLQFECDPAGLYAGQLVVVERALITSMFYDGARRVQVGWKQVAGSPTIWRPR
jgi:hypothetical protein